MSKPLLFEINAEKYSIAFAKGFNLYRICEYSDDLKAYIFYTGVRAGSVEEAIDIFRKRELERKSK